MKKRDLFPMNEMDLKFSSRYFFKTIQNFRNTKMSSTSCDLCTAKLLRPTVKEEMHLQEKTLFDL